MFEMNTLTSICYVVIKFDVKQSDVISCYCGTPR